MFFKIFLLVFFAVIDVMCEQLPTLEAVNPLYPTDDAQKLHKALYQTTFGISNPNEKAIINILAYRTLDQRLFIGEQYQKLYNESLTDRLYEKLTEQDFRDAIHALMTPRNEYYPKQLDIECNLGFFTYGLWVHRIDGIMEILLSFEYDDITSHSYYGYTERGHWRLINYLRSLTNSEVASSIVLSFFVKSRQKNETVSEEIAIEDVTDVISRAGHWGEHEGLFHLIFMYRSFPQLRRFFELYFLITGKDIEDAIKSEFKNDRDGRESYLAIVRYVRNKPNYFASRLKNAMDRVFINTETLTRIVVARAEIDLENIKQEYHQFGTNLCDDIDDGTSGDYGDLMLALIGKYHETQ